MTFVSAVLSNSFKSRIASLFSMNLSRLFHCSVIKVLYILLLFSNFYILSDIQVFVNNFFVVRCQIMSCPAVSLTMLPSGYYFVNPFFPKISLSYVYFRKVNFTVSVHLSRKDIFPPYFISISHPSHIFLTQKAFRISACCKLSLFYYILRVFLWL